MSNQTLRQPPSNSTNRKPSSSSQGGRKSSTRYQRQRAHGGLDIRRDGKPLIFGWGRQFSRLQKHRIQNRAAYTFWAIIIVAILGVFGFGVLQQNVLIPNQSIIAVNGTGITQNSYRKYLAYTAQTLWNRLQSELKQQAQASQDAQAGKAGAANRDQALISLIQADEGNYAQATITQTAIDNLTNDQLIQNGARQFEAKGVSSAKFTPSAKQIDDALNAFKQAFPKGETYAQFLSQDSLSNDDVRAGLAVDLRHDMMKSYITTLITSPTQQFHVRRIQVGTSASAASVRAQLVKDSSDAHWATLAKQLSLDATSKTVGGDLGWIFYGNGEVAIDNWVFSSTPKTGDFSPILLDSTGTFDVAQVLGVDANRVVDPTSLQAAQSNAIDHWIGGQKVLPGVHITTADQTMETASRNMPSLPNLNAALPNFNPNSGAGSPGSSIPGVPGGSVPSGQ